VSVRRSAAQALLLYRVPAWAIESVQARLTDADPATRKAAVTILGGTRDSSVLDDVIAALSDPAPDVRAEAAAALSTLAWSRITDVGSLAPLARLLADEIPHVAYAAYWALGWQGGSSVESLRARWRRSERGRDVWASVVGRE
jgi:HEAT repeat protein